MQSSVLLWVQNVNTVDVVMDQRDGKCHKRICAKYFDLG